MAVVTVCDLCERPMPIDTIDFNDGLGPIKCVETHRTKVVRTNKIFPYLCESCANKLDRMFEELNLRSENRREIMERYYRINQERRNKYGSKG